MGSVGRPVTISPAVACDLLSSAVNQGREHSGVRVDDIREVVMGCIGQVGPDAYNTRRVALGAGMPKSTPAYTVNRLCGSGLQAIWSAAMEMRWNDLDFTVAGGNESMARMPFYDFGARTGYKLGDRALVDGTVGMLTDPFHGVHMGITAENVAEKYGVSRIEQDEFAAESQRRASTAVAKSAFAEEIVLFEVGGRKPFTVSEDEHPKTGTTMEVFASCGRPSPRAARSQPATLPGSTTGLLPWCLLRRRCSYRSHGVGAYGICPCHRAQVAVREDRQKARRHRHDRAQ